MAAIFPALYSIIWLYNRIFLNIAYTILQLICTARVSRIPSINSSVSWAVLDLVGGKKPLDPGVSAAAAIPSPLQLALPLLPVPLNFFEFEICWFRRQQLLLTTIWIYIYLYVLKLYIYIFGTICHLAMPPRFAWKYIQNTLGSSLFSLRSCHFGACPIFINLLDTPKHHIILLIYPYVPGTCIEIEIHAFIISFHFREQSELSAVWVQRRHERVPAWPTQHAGWSRQMQPWSVSMR